MTRQKGLNPRKEDRISPFFGQVLRMRRNDMGMSPGDVAALIGCSPATVQYHEAGAAFLPRPWLFFGFAEALKLDPWEMQLTAYYAMPMAFRARFLTAMRTGDRKKIERELGVAA